MSVITNRGKQAKESANKQRLDFKKLYVRLKDGESVRVRVPSAEEYVEYQSHGAFDLGIYTQPCIAPTGSRCAYDEVAEYVRAMEIDKDDKEHPFYSYRGLYAKPRYLFALYDIDEKMVRLFDASKDQAKKLIDDIEQYEDSLEELAFTFKRTGTKSSTTYGLAPILKLKAEDKAKFEEFEGEVPFSLYEQALLPRTFEQQLEELRKAGFPADSMNELFGDAIKADDESKPIEDPTGTF
jgi:hypothetical protein